MDELSSFELHKDSSLLFVCANLQSKKNVSSYDGTFVSEQDFDEGF